MNKSLNVFLSVLLCVVLCVGVISSIQTTDDSSVWSSSRGYSPSAATKSGAVTHIGVGSNGNSLSVPISSRRSSREQYLQPSRRSTGVADLQGFARSANSTGMLSLPSLQGGDGGRLITYMSSSQQTKSFGGGSNGNVSMSNGVVSSNTPSSSTSLLALSPNIPLTSSPNNLIASSPTSLIASSPYLLPDGTASMPTLRGINGRHNAPGNAAYNNWLNWLWGYGYEYGSTTDDYLYTFNNAQTEAAYLAWFEAAYGCLPENYRGPTPALTYDQWLGMFLQNGGEHHKGDYTYLFTPVGDLLPLLILAMMYLLYSIISSRRLNLSLRNNITKQ